MQTQQPDVPAISRARREALCAAMTIVIDTARNQPEALDEALAALRRCYRIGPSRQVFARNDVLRPFRMLAYDCIRHVLREPVATRRAAWIAILDAALGQLPEHELTGE